MRKRRFSILVIVLLVAASIISTTVILAGEEDALDAYEAKLAIMVEEGKLTPEQADAKLDAYQSETSDSVFLKKKSAITDEALQEKLAAMVTNGEITQDQADEKIRWLLLKKK